MDIPRQSKILLLMECNELDTIIDEEPNIPQNQRDIKSSTPNEKRELFSNIDRQLSEDELHDSSILKILINERDEFILCKQKLEEYRAKYYEIGRDNAVLKEKINSDTSNEILYSVMLALGPALLGLLPSLSGENVWIYFVMGLTGLGLIIGAIIAKVRRK